MGPSKDLAELENSVILGDVGLLFPSFSENSVWKPLGEVEQGRPLRLNGVAQSSNEEEAHTGVGGGGVGHCEVGARGE